MKIIQLTYIMFYIDTLKGGRVGIHCRRNYAYGGVLRNRGGLQNPGTAPSFQEPLHGAAGTIYLEETLRQMRYRHRKYDKQSNTSLLSADHIHLLIDNEGSSIIYDPLCIRVLNIE